MAQQLKVFVSHSSNDKAACDTFVTALRRAGADVWYDEHNLGAGQLLEEIQREVQGRPIFVVLLSKSAFGSTWVRRETTWAFNLYNREPNRLILPVTVGGIQPSDFNGSWLFLEDFKRIEASGYKPFALAEAIQRTLRLLELTPAGQAPAPVAAPQPAETLDDLLAKGKALTAQKKVAEAIRFLERATQVGPRSFDAWANLAKAYIDAGRAADGLAASERALALDDKQAWVWANKSSALNNLKRYSEALTAAERAIAIDPNHSIAWNNKGVAYSGLGRNADRLAAYEKATTLDPKNAITWKNKGAALNDLKRYNEAITACERAIALDPKYAEPWVNKGVAYSGLNRDAESVAAYDKAIALDPNFALTWKNKAIALRRLGRTKEAEEADRRAKALGG